MHFLVRTCIDRLAGDGGHTVADEMDEVWLKGLHRVQTSDQKGNVADVVLEIRYRRIKVLPPIGKQSRYPFMVNGRSAPGVPCCVTARKSLLFHHSVRLKIGGHHVP